jgi:hypothetical protein
MSGKSFAQEYPKDCPPSDATDADGEFFRFVKSNPATDQDFLSHCELELRPTGDSCLRCGLSIFSTEEGALRMLQHIRRSSPGVKMGNYVARIELQASDGRLKQTGRPPHHTWWTYVSTNRLATCCEVKEVPDDLAHK